MNKSNSQNIAHVPHLATAVTGSLCYLEQQFLDNQLKIETWLRQQWKATPPNITSSVDLRNAGFKIAPVDTNLFPAGFNNLNKELLPLCIQAAQIAINNAMPDCKHILLISEISSKNPFYWQSLATLQKILIKAGYAVRIGFPSEALKQAKTITLEAQQTLTLEPIIRQGNTIKVADFDPCLILLNNDLSAGIPPVLQGIKQTIKPIPKLGWETRLKSEHFAHYQAITHEFAQLLGIDPWLISPLFRNCGSVDFKTGEGENCLVSNTKILLQQITDKYAEYDIKQKPFVVVKADSGTYGMGVMMVDDPQILHQLNRKQRNRMTTTKDRQKLDKVIIQEGIPTFETWEDAVAEPVIYMLGKFVIGGFYRIHTGLGKQDNLNAPGMHFQPLAFTQACNNPDSNLAPEDSPNNRFYAYGVVARLAALAAAREAVQLEKTA